MLRGRNKRQKSAHRAESEGRKEAMSEEDEELS
jgi:hypothetical protein